MNSFFSQFGFKSYDYTSMDRYFFLWKSTKNITVAFDSFFSLPTPKSWSPITNFMSTYINQNPNFSTHSPALIKDFTISSLLKPSLGFWCHIQSYLPCLLFFFLLFCSKSGFPKITNYILLLYYFKRLLWPFLPNLSPRIDSAVNTHLPVSSVFLNARPSDL